MSTRLVGDELDVNLSALAARLLVVVIVVVRGAPLGRTRAIVGAVASAVILLGSGGIVVVNNIGHVC